VLETAQITHEWLPRCLGLAKMSDMTDKRGFSDSGLTGDEDHSASASSGLRYVIPQVLEKGLSARAAPRIHLIRVLRLVLVSPALSMNSGRLPACWGAMARWMMTPVAGQPRAHRA